MDEWYSDVGVDSADMDSVISARVYEIQEKELRRVKRVLAASGVKDGL